MRRTTCIHPAASLALGLSLVLMLCPNAQAGERQAPETLIQTHPTARPPNDVSSVDMSSSWAADTASGRTDNATPLRVVGEAGARAGGGAPTLSSDLCLRIYDNTGSGSQQYYAGQAGSEAIDDVHGEGSGALGAVTFEYVADEPCAAWVRVYDNPGGRDYGMIPLYGPIEVAGLEAGRHVVTVDIPDGPLVGPDLWVGVRFTSLDAGLVIQEQPFIGMSNDYYIENGSFFFFMGHPKANFAICVDVRLPPEPVSLIALLDNISSVDALLRTTDPQTGQFEEAGPLGQACIETQALAILPPGGACQDPSAILEDRLFVVDNDRLIEINPLNGQGTVLGPVGITDIRGIAFHPQSRQLYAVTGAGNHLLTLNLNTGAGQIVATVPLARQTLLDLAFHPDGRAYITTDGAPQVLQIDLVSGTPIAKWRLTGGTALRALAWSQDGSTLYALATRERSPELAVAVLSDKDDVGAVQFLSPGRIGFEGIEDIAFLNENMADDLLNQVTSTGPPPKSSFRLYPNRPNPFNPATRIDFELESTQHVQLVIHDVLGRHVVTLLEADIPAGRHHVIWNGTTTAGEPAPSGVYYCILRGGRQRAAQPMVLIR